MGESIARKQSADWGHCADPGVFAEATCCNDTKKYGISEPFWAYDRVATCRGGFVDEFKVEPSYFCGANEEHRFITARVWIANPQSAFCLDHPRCAGLGLSPLDGLCCPVKNGKYLACCNETEPEVQ